MDIMGFLTYLWNNHRNASVGVIIGLCIGICFATFGFLKTVVVLFCLAVGLLVGLMVDKNGGWKKIAKNYRNNKK